MKNLPFEQLLLLIFVVTVFLMRILGGRRPSDSTDESASEPGPAPRPVPRRVPPTAPRRSRPVERARDRPKTSAPARQASSPPTAAPVSTPAGTWPAGSQPLPKSAPSATQGLPTAPARFRQRPWPAEALRQPDGGRKAIVLMTILGPPRTLEPPP